MKIFKRKLLPILLTCMLLLAAVPTVIFASAEPAVVSSEKELIEAVEAVEKGGTGEITFASGVNLQINKTLNIEGKSIVLNLNNAFLIVVNKTLFNVVNGNLTINAGECGMIRVEGESGGFGNTKGMGIISISGKSSTLTINDGNYNTSKEDNALVVSSGAKAVIDGAYVDGALKAVGTDDEPAGEIVINSGIFNTDVSAFVKDKWCGEVNGSWYVREKEYSDEFTKLFPDNKLVVNFAPPSNEDELHNVALILYWEYIEKYGVFIDPGTDSFNDDYSKCEVRFVETDGLVEIHTLDVVWNYDSATYEKAKALIENFPEDIEYFNVTDLELINYFLNSDPDSEDTVDSLANYSSQLKGYLKNSNFSFDIEVGAGADDDFITKRLGMAKLTYDGTAYYANPSLGAQGEHAIYVPASTGDTAEELLAAAQKRIDGYIGEGKVKITLGEKTVTKYYKDTLAECDPYEKDYFKSRFEEGGDLYFMKKAAGDYLFDVKIGEETYQFIVIKDDAKLTVPTYTSVDLGTSVEVKTDSAEVPLDTAVTVEKLTSGEEYNRIIKAIGTENGEMFEIKLYSASLDKYITKLENGKFEVKLPIPEKLQNKNLVVYYVDSANKVTEHEVTVKDGYAIFTTDHFSIYTLAEKVTTATEEPKQEETKNTEIKTETLPQAGDNSQLTLLLALAFVSAAILFGTNKVLKKSRKN